MARLPRITLLASVLSVAAAGCTSGNSAIQPPYQSSNIAAIGKLQFAVGTATLSIASSSGPQYVIGLNTVVTFRKADGTSATAVNTPAIVGPANFVVPNSPQAGGDAGTNAITGTAQTGSSKVATTFGYQGQASLYGFGPNNYNVSGSAPFGNYALPFYSDQLPSSSSSGFPATTFFGVAPAFPQSSIGGFSGYNLGFVDFVATPVSGTYTLSVNVPVSPGSSQTAATYKASASLKASAVLPPFATAVFVPTAGGGGTVEVKLPPGVTEAYAQLSDANSGATFGFAFHSSVSQTLPAGAMAPCDSFSLVVAGFDYPALEAAAPHNTAQTPDIVGSHGQSDLTVSYPANGQVPPSGTGPCSSARVRR